MKNKQAFNFAIILVFPVLYYAQEGRVGINTSSPKTTLDVRGKTDSSGNLISTDLTGFQAPRLTLAELTAKGDALYGTDQKGTLIYITDVSGGSVASQRANINSIGYYFFDGLVWQKFGSSSEADATVGSVSTFAYSAIPTDYLECNGAVVSRTTYSVLFAKIGTVYGAGDGSTTFNLPDLRGEFIRGWDNNKGTDSGRALGSWQKGSIVAFDPDAGNYDPVGMLKPSTENIDQAFGMDAIGTASYTAQLRYSVITGSPIGVASAAGVTRPRNVAMVYAIKAKESVILPTSTSAAVITAATQNEPWYNAATQTPATSNSQNIYQMGQILINTSTVPAGGTNAKLIINNGSIGGALQIKDGTEGTGKVLTSDANGVGRWMNGNNTGWTLMGNSDTTASTAAIGSVANNNFIGTTDAKDVVFASNNYERMRISSGGSIGIGTSLPNSNAVLDISSSTKGVKLPSVALVSTNTTTPLTAHIAGMLVYNTATAGTAPNNVVPGLYTNDGTRWILLQTPGGAAYDVPTGSVFYRASTTVPSGYLECNGAAVSRTTYATLFALIGTTYGVGNGSTTFNLPDLRGEFIRGWDNGRGIDSGRTLGSSQSGYGGSFTWQKGTVNVTIGSTPVTDWLSINGDTSNDETSIHTANVTNGDIRPRNVGLMPIIKY